VRYKLYTYDLWGNDKDGYQINDYYEQSDIYEVIDPDNDSDLISMIDFTNPESIEINHSESCNDYIYFQTHAGKPVCELRRIDQ